MAQTITLTQPQQRTTAKSIQPQQSSTHSTTKQYKRVPSVKPPFTVGDVRRAIPAECFQHSYVKSFSYLALDLFLSCCLFYASTYINVIFSDTTYTHTVLRAVSWCVYWYVQGNVWTGLWVLAHECGHGGFSASETVNDIVGFIVHSFLMVPYFSWKISHRRHHSNTGNLDRDEVFVPDVVDTHDDENYAMDFITQIKDSIVRLFNLTIMLTLGWPAYLAMNVSGNRSYKPNEWINHFTPYNELFRMHTPELTKQQARQIIYSDIGIACTVALMTVLGYKYGLTSIICYYVIPLMQNIMWLVIITFLQHTDKALPHYDSTEWDWLRGALATIDRDYGLLNYFHHHIGDTHIVHHIFHQMPFYNAQRATDAVKPLLGEYYVMDRTPIFKALWNNYGTCTGVKACDKQSGVYWF